jgi:hypothetical protein
MRLNWPWAILSLTYQWRMSKDFESFWRVLEFRTPWAVLLLVSMREPVFGCGCPISVRAVIIAGHAFFVPRQIPAVSASAAEDATFLMVLQKTSTGPLTFIGFPTKMAVDGRPAAGFWWN